MNYFREGKKNKVLLSKTKKGEANLNSKKTSNTYDNRRITIPSEIRKKYGWKDGDKVIIIDHPLEGIIILPHLTEESLESIIDKELGIKIVKEISKERKKEIELEKERLYMKNNS
ncbi:MAG: AbrB/MazE/SpoVT family DNA-binding domain-containing protein [Promethearchaeota archaeon]